MDLTGILSFNFHNILKYSSSQVDTHANAIPASGIWLSNVHIWISVFLPRYSGLSELRQTACWLLVTSFASVSIWLPSAHLSRPDSQVLWFLSHAQCSFSRIYHVPSHLKVNLIPSLAYWNRFSSQIALHLVPSLLHPNLPIFPVPANEKHPDNTMLPPSCFAGGEW